MEKRKREHLKKITIMTDGGAKKNPGRAASAFIIQSDEDGLLCVHGEYVGITTNNVAEYKAVVMSLKYVKEHFKDGDYLLLSDSQLVVKQLSGEYKVKARELLSFWSEAKSLIEELNARVEWIPREKNKVADFLVGMIRRGKSG